MDENYNKKVKARTPFNLSLLNLDSGNIYKQLGKVTSGNMFDGANYNLHPEGLWSNEIFGPVGDPLRLKKQAYMDLNVEILHPLVYRELISTNKLLDEIMAGTTFAVFDEETKQFVRSNAIDGETGYDFFFRNFDKYQLPDTGSPKRRETIKLIEKNKDILKINKFIILQAGYRDVEFKDGQISHDEVNQIYRELLSLASSIGSTSHKSNMALLNNTRYAIQKTALKLFMYLGEITGHGKKKLIQGKWASRNVFQTTRNVITAPKASGRFAHDKDNQGYNNIVVGLYQQLVSCLPFAIRGIKNSFLKDKFSDPLHPVKLVNKKTLKEEDVYLNQDWFDVFQSDEGIRKLIHRFKPDAVRHKAIEVDGYYLALIYKGPDNTFKIMNSITELPPDRSKEDVHPLTFIELLYICTYHEINDTPGFATRYPITGIGSNVPGNTIVMTTTKTEKRKMLNDNWELDDNSLEFLKFPVYGMDSFNSMSPPVTSYQGMGADNDGDMTNLICSFTEESKNEIKQYKKEKKAYVGSDGRIRYPLGFDTINFVCHNLGTFEESVK